jgi:hypothetical protein
MKSTIDLKSILGWERLPLFGRFGYVEMIKCLIIKTLPPCRLSTELSVLSVCGHRFSDWRIAAYLRRSVRVWKLRRGILFSNIDGRIAYVLLLQFRQDYNCSV